MVGSWERAYADVETCEQALSQLPTNELPLGVVRIYADPDRVSGEFAILVRSDLHGHGLGTALTYRIIEVARWRGLSRLVGSVLRDNGRMPRLVRELGFVAEEAREDEVTMVLML